MKNSPPLLSLKFNVQKLSRRLRKTFPTLKLLFDKLTAIFYLLINFFIPVILPLSLFVVFFWTLVFPVLVAQCILPTNIFTIVIAGLGYLLLCIFDIILLYILVADLYRLKRHLLFIPKKYRESSATERTQSKTKTVVFYFLSFFLTPYCFAIVYIFISALNQHAFSVGKLGLLSAIRLSFTLMIPGVSSHISSSSIIAQLATTFELIFGYLYTVFITTVIVIFIRER